MPELDGFGVLKELQKDEKLSLIPVIVSTSAEGEASEIRSLSLGAQDFIAKPYNTQIIRHRLANLIRLRESAAIINKTQKDALTGLFNKEFFLNSVEDILKDSPDEQFDIIHVGIERFKLINDAYGIKKGDKVLKYIANVIQESCGIKAICSRFMGDNFYVFRKRVSYTNELFQPWIEKIEKCPVEMDIKVHCGIYEITDPSMEIQSMCDRAEMASTRNKGKYEQLFTMYDDSMRKVIVSEQVIVGNMKTALEEGQFQVYYQPKYDLNSEMIAGAEALVRWIHPENGFMSPGEFIPIFEKNGFITKLDRFVWERTCQNIRQWMDKGITPFPVSVNVSRADIYNPKLIDILLELVAKYMIPIRYLHLEITESAYTENPEQIIETVKRLRIAGFIIEMDDFGTDYSSLNMLAEMPVDVMKLDMRFIQTESKISQGKGILGFIVSLAKWMGLSVVAEGVETADQIELLRSIDCDYVQGYYYAKPMKVEDFEEIIKNSKISEMVCYRSDTSNEQQMIQETGKQEGPVMLIVDDVEVNRASLASAFYMDYVIVQKENGLEAWNYLEEHYDQVEIILLDLLMPVMDGFQLMNRIRMDERMKDLPIIVTSQAGFESERKSLDLQANDYISKPYNMDVIRHRVKNVVGNYKLHRLYEGMLTEEEVKDGIYVKKDKHSMDDKILLKMESLKNNFDIVRLVSPTETEIYSGDTYGQHHCYSVWGKDERCNNCTSLKAYQNRTRLNKLEFSENGLYFVISQYVPYGEKGAVMEMVTKLEDEYVDNVFDKDLLYFNLEELNSQAEIDDLTGMYNRRHLDIYLKKYMNSAKRTGKDIGIAMVDVDHFKEINDARGHLAGDEVLKKISKMLKENIAISKGDFITRFGGDEFIIVCRNIKPKVFRKRIAAVANLIQHSNDMPDDGIILSISAGCVMFSEYPDKDENIILEHADQRLYRAKAKGRNCIVFDDKDK